MMILLGRLKNEDYDEVEQGDTPFLSNCLLERNSGFSV